MNGINNFFGILACGIFVLFYAYDRFNTPPTNRVSTTRYKYLSWFLIYGLFSLLEFAYLPIVFAWLLKHAPGLFEILFPVNPAIKSAFNGKPGPLSYIASAIIMTVALPKIQILSRVDRGIRRTLYRAAAIPREVSELASDLKNTQVDFLEEYQAKIITLIKQHQVDENDFLPCPKKGPNEYWTKLVSMMCALDTLKNDTKYSAFFKDFDNQYRALRSDYTSIQSKFFDSVEIAAEIEMKSHRLGGKLYTALEKHLDEITSGLRDCLENAYDFLARAVLSQEINRTAVNRRLESLGFRSISEICEERSKDGRITFHHLAALGLAFFCVMFVWAWILPLVSTTDLSLTAKWLEAIRAATIIPAAIGCGVFAHRVSRQRAHPQKGKAQRLTTIKPVGWYLLGGLLAIGAQFGLNFLIETASKQEIAISVDDLKVWLGFSPFIFAIGTAVAWMCNDRESRFVRWREGLITAGAMAFAMKIGREILFAFGQSKQFQDIPWFAVYIVVTIVGFIIGCLVPHWYRHSEQSELVMSETPEDVYA